MKINEFPLLAILFYVCMTIGLTAAFAGEDDPPGPPGSPETRMKSLNQIEPRTIISTLPYVITNRGSYYLTQNLEGIAGSNGITIACSDVDLDLNGFSIKGVTNIYGSSGIVLDTATNLYMNLTIHNGIVCDWPNAGLVLTDGLNCRVIGISTVRNGLLGGTGIYLGKDWEARECVAFRNYCPGFIIGNYSRIRDSRARENSGTGFNTGIGSVIESCLAAENNGYGFFGQTESVIRNCVAICNTNDGIYVGPNSIASDNLSSENGGDGMSAGAGSKLSGNIASLNKGHGINVSSYSVADNNLTSGNRGAGVYGGWSSRIQNNHATGNSRGFEAMSNSKGNLFVGNTALDNATNYLTAPLANFGRIVESKDLGPDFLLANPWANFNLQ